MLSNKQCEKLEKWGMQIDEYVFSNAKKPIAPELEELLKFAVEKAPKKDTISCYYSKEFKVWNAESILLNITCVDKDSAKRSVFKLIEYLMGEK